jgi:hypothetical protein
MIKIEKGDSPAELITKCTEVNTKHFEDFDKNPDDYLAGKKSFDIKGYGLTVVKEALKERQFNKCCFSEVKFSGEYPDIEHFRPKKRVDNYDTKEQLFPGYYWLAYEWSNLFYCKAVINTTYKRNFFPLYNELERNRTHHDTFIEKSIFIDPSIEDPRNFIRFEMDEPVGIDKEGRGLFNIINLGLRDTSFADDRSDKLIALQLSKSTVDIGLAEGISIDSDLLAPHIKALEEAMQPSAEFSSMAIDLLQGWPPLQSNH